MSQDSRELKTAVVYNRAASIVRAHLSELPNGAFRSRSATVAPNNLRQGVALKSPQLFREAIPKLGLNPVPQQLLDDVTELETCARNISIFYKTATELLERTDNLIYASQLVETEPTNSYLRAELKTLIHDFCYDLNALLHTDDGTPSADLVNRLLSITSKLRDLQLPGKESRSYERYVLGYREAEVKLEVELLLVML